MLVLDRELVEEYAKERPAFGLAFMRRVLWLIGNHLKMTRTRLVAARYGSVPQTVRALLDQNAATLSVTSPLHKIPHYLENRLTVDDAYRTLQIMKAEGDEVERELAAQIADLLDEVWREVEIFRRLQSIYELVAGAPTTMSPEELRRKSCEAFAELFEATDYVIHGEENLPGEPGHIFVMNHLSNHLDNLLPNDFILTLDTYFVSSMILLKKYGEAPVRVVRKSDPGEYGHQKFYDRLGYIYVYSGHVDPVDDDTSSTPEERRRLFLDTAREHLKNGKNIVICPEGTSTETENSPLPFKSGRSEEHTSELQSRQYLVCRLLLEKQKRHHPGVDRGVEIGRADRDAHDHVHLGPELQVVTWAGDGRLPAPLAVPRAGHQVGEAVER